MRNILFTDAINEALAEEMRKNPDIIIMGEDVGFAGGVRNVTKGLYAEFGEERVKDTPISEAIIVGAGCGAALTGLRPVVEIMYSDFLGVSGDEVFNKMAKWRYMHGGSMTMPMVLRTACGGGFGGAAEHSQSLESLFMHIPGLTLLYPTTPYEAKGLLKQALHDDNPIIFFEHRLLYKTRGNVPEGEYYIPFGKADIKRAGKDVTVVSYGYQMLAVLSAAEKLAQEGIDMEVIDLRTLSPLDRTTILESIAKTGRLVIVEEGHKTLGVGAEIAAMAAEEAMYYLEGPVKRVAALDIPIPYSPPMEKFVLPNEEKIIKGIREVIEG